MDAVIGSELAVAGLVLAAWLIGGGIGFTAGRIAGDERQIALAAAWRREAARRIEVESQLERLLPAGDDPIELLELFDAADEAEALDNAGAGAWLEILRRDVGRDNG